MFKRNKNPRKTDKLRPRQGTRDYARARVIRSSVGNNKISQRPTSNAAGSLRITRFLLVLLIASGIVWSGLLTSVNVTANRGAVNNYVTQTANQYFSAHRQWWWFVSKEDFIRQLKEGNPYIADISISRGLLMRDVTINVNERQAALRLRADNRQFIISGDGVVLEMSEDELDIPLVHDEASSNSLIEVGESYLPSTLVSAIQTIEERLIELDFSVKEHVLTDDTREIRTYIRDDYFIKFSPDSAISDQVKDLLSVKSKLGSQIDYVDVRFNGKVYIK